MIGFTQAQTHSQCDILPHFVNYIIDNCVRVSEIDRSVVFH